jgi:hypothetical protein
VSAGIGAAWLVILRETNAILSAPFGHNVSTTKYFFSDLPTALACAFFVWMLTAAEQAETKFSGITFIMHYYPAVVWES